MDNSDKQNKNNVQGNSIGGIKGYLLSLIKKKKENQKENVQKEITNVLTSQDTLDALSQQDALKYIATHVKDYQGLGRTIGKFKLAEQLPEYDPNNSPYLYRGIKIDLATLKNIVSHNGLQVNETGENEGTYFVMGKPQILEVISHAFTNKEKLSVIFQIPISLLEKYDIKHGGAGDNVRINKDIPAELIQQTNIFLIDYTNNTLIQIKGNSESQTLLNSSEQEKTLIDESVSETIDKENLEDPLSRSYKATQIAKKIGKIVRRGLTHGSNRIPAWGSAKVGAESLVGWTLGFEKLSLTQRKLYGLGAALSGLGYAFGYLLISSGFLWTAGFQFGMFSLVASVVTAVGQASIIGGKTDIGVLFKAQLSKYLESMKDALKKLRDEKLEQKNKENINDVEKNIAEVQKVVDGMSDEEAGEMVKEVITDEEKK